MGHKIFVAELEVDQAKVSIIKTRLTPTTVKRIRSFLGHAGFYKRFIRDFSKTLDHYANCWKKMQILILMNHADLHLKKLSPNWLQLPSWQHLTGTKSLKSCVMPMTMQCERYWDKKLKRYLGPYNMPAKPLMRHKRTTLPQKRRCWQWYFLVKNSSLTYWGPML